MKIKANEDLFDKWTNLAHRIDMLKSIVQNDMELSQSEIADWLLTAHNMGKELDVLLNETINYLLNHSHE